MPFTELTFGFEEILTSSKMNVMETNIDEVRRSHKASSAPPAPTAGTLWLNDSADPWVWNMYDGTSWITLGTISPSNDRFFARGAGPVWIKDVTPGGTADTIQDDSLLGKTAFRIIGNNISANSTGSDLRFRFYDDGAQVDASNYVEPIAGGGENRVQLTANLESTSRTWQVKIDCWTTGTRWRVEWLSIRSGDGATLNGFAYYANALSAVTGALIFLDTGSFDQGTWSLYEMPDWTNS